MGNPTPDPLFELHRDDLIDDRSLTSDNEADDAFGLRDIADEVAQLCRTVPTPATVAVYGSWGSGKSSLGNLLKARLTRGKGVRFARFNAFKYAEHPLRRHFLSQLAEKFDVDDSKFSEGLYEETKGLKLKPGADEGRPLAKKAALVLGGAVLGASLLAGFLSLIVAVADRGSKGGFGSHFAAAFRASLPGIVLASPVIAVIAALLLQLFTAQTTTGAASSDEQFETLFKKLVKKIIAKHGCERIVVFIDELDRCSPAQVVAVLETLRTFLEVRPCVFVVAADQQALEHALTGAARQATPVNTANPYYSAGSAYLDKIFQYQLSLPPILPRRLSKFALDLVKEREGIWARLPDRGWVVSILVPPHVTSPRRVKALLNAFALLFRLALKRAAAGEIEAEVAARAPELAKLVCLRLEFPVFGDDLRLNDQLPEIVLWLRDHEDVQDAEAIEDEETDDGTEDDEAKAETVEAAFPTVNKEILTRARGYARAQIAVDQVITRSTSASDDGQDRESRAATRKVEKSQGEQLIRYLEFTRDIANPKRDLIYLESSGSAFGLPANVADQLENAAIANRVEEVKELLVGLGEQDQQRSFRLLARLAYELVGLDVANVLKALFATLTATTTDLAPIADDVLTRISGRRRPHPPAVEDLPGALRLALAGSNEAAHELRSEVLARSEALVDKQLSLLILREAASLTEETARVAEVFTSAVTQGHGADAEDALANVPDEIVEQLVRALEVDEDDDDQVASLESFMAGAKKRGRERVARRALMTLLALTSASADDILNEQIETFAPITDSELTTAVIAKALTRPVQEWLIWLGALDDSVISTQKDGVGADVYLTRLWQARFDPQTGSEELSADEFAVAARQVARLRATDAAEATDVLADEAVVTTAALATAREERFTALWELVDLDVLSEATAADWILADIERTLAAAQLPAVTNTLTELVLETADDALAVADETAIRTFATAAENSPWLPEIAAHIINVNAASALHQFGLADEAQQASLDALVADRSEAATAALAEWIKAFGPTPAELYRTLAPQLGERQRLDEPLALAVSEAASGWTAEEKADALEAIAPNFLRGDLDDSVIRAMDLAGAEGKRVADLLIASYEPTNKNTEREAVMNLWELLAPQGDALRRVVDHVYIPLLSEGKGAAAIALKFFKLVRQPPSNAVRERTKKAILSAVDADEALTKRARKQLEDAEWIARKKKKKKFGLF